MISTVTDILLALIKSMRETCDAAERVALDKTRSDANKVAQVFHIMTWGWANAGTNIELSISRIEYDTEVLLLQKGEMSDTV